MTFLKKFGPWHKFHMVIAIVFIFSVIYTFYDNEAFAGWIDITQIPVVYDVKHKKNRKAKVFLQYAKKYKNFMTHSEFMKIPIIKLHKKLHVALENTSETQSKYYDDAKNLLFSIYAHDDKMDIDEFNQVPFEYDISHIKVEHAKKVIDLTTLYAVNDYYDRLYYSITIQSTLGFGDIFPATKSLRFATMIQALSTILIIIL